MTGAPADLQQVTTNQRQLLRQVLYPLFLFIYLFSTAHSAATLQHPLCFSIDRNDVLVLPRGRPAVLGRSDQKQWTEGS